MNSVPDQEIVQMPTKFGCVRSTKYRLKLLLDNKLNHSTYDVDCQHFGTYQRM